MDKMIVVLILTIMGFIFLGTDGVMAMGYDDPFTYGCSIEDFYLGYCGPTSGGGF